MGSKGKFDYFDGFVRQMDCACEGSARLVALVNDFRPQDEGWAQEQLTAIHAIENACDEVTHDIITHLAVEFMPPIDREDVSELAQCLDDVMDGIDEIVQHLYMYDLHELHPGAVALVGTLNAATVALRAAVKAFDEFKKPKKLGRLIADVHARESEGDERYMEAKRDLFVNHADAPVAYLLGWNSMYSHMEKACDACERAASIMSTIALKNT